MKIIDRETFMKMPKGTVFCKFPIKDYAPNYMHLGIDTPCILDDTWETDFVLTGLDNLHPKDGDYTETLLDMREHPGKEVPFEYWSGRDGMYDGDEVGFAVFSRQEVQEMITLLQEALENGYKED